MRVAVWERIAYWLVIAALVALLWTVWVRLNTAGAPNRIEYIRKEELIRRVDAPNGEYALNVYAGWECATVDFSVLVELAAGDYTRTIYYEYHAQDAEIVWLSDYEVEINGRALDVRGETYQWGQDFTRPGSLER